MEEATTAEPVCAKEALDLLNCVAAEPLDRDTCIRLLDALRTCVLHKGQNREQSSRADRMAAKVRGRTTPLIMMVDINGSGLIGNIPPMNSLGTSMKVKKFSLAQKSSAAEVPESKGDKA